MSGEEKKIISVGKECFTVLLFLSSRIESNVWLDSDLRKNEKNIRGV